MSVGLTTALRRTPAPELILSFARLEAGAAWRKLVRSVGVGRPPALDLDALTPPDSEAIRRAIALARATSPDFLVTHGLRSFYFAAAIGAKYRWRFDREVVFIACLLHDLGLTDYSRGEGSFEVRGARAARDHLLEGSYERARADMVHEAIALHSSVGVAERGGIETRLVHFGTGVDVIGFRREDVADGVVGKIVAKHPRLEFKRRFTALLEEEVSADARCHIAGHMALGFAGKIKAAPFEE